MINLRPIRTTDLDKLLFIEEDSFPIPYTKKDFKSVLKITNNIGVLAELDGEIVGYMIYKVDKVRYDIISIAVSPKRNGIGKVLIKDLINNLNPTRNTIGLSLNDTNLTAHLFFRSMGFKAIDVEKNFYGPGVDGYDFTYVLNSKVKNKKILQEK